MVGKKELCIIDFTNPIVVSFSFSEADYVRAEPVRMIPAKISKGQDVLLANPVWFRVTPLTVEQALNRSVIDSYDMDNIVSPTRAGK